ncbi:MAG: hypothetical protein PHE03_02495 [Bacteroidales bacterium]|nr:hypothetical protein [Bacteroidales bacterium]MDD3891146.1 hypothetical protein [Bacteroidales bacterium]
MDFFIDYIGWLLIALTVLVFSLYKWISKNSRGLTAQYEIGKRINLLNKNKHELFIEALKQSHFKNIHFDENNSTYYAKTKASIWSWSELIEIRVTDIGDETEINFLSICSLFTQIMSWGKNRRNAKKFFKELNKLL